MARSKSDNKPQDNAKPDDAFYDRADSFIELANDHCADTGRGKVSASFMYATARFNAWVSATGYGSQEAMRKGKEETIEYFVAQARPSASPARMALAGRRDSIAFTPSAVAASVSARTVLST